MLPMSFNRHNLYTFRFKSIRGETHYIILDKQFILNKMNHITHRLLGLNTDDDLTTDNPSRDESGAYTIFDELGISWESMHHLICFLRMNQLDKNFHNSAMQAAISLGGFKELDQYILSSTATIYYPPKHPNDDYKSEYEWMIISALDENIINDSRNKGFICTGIQAECNNPNPYVYYRKRINQNI